MRSYFTIDTPYGNVDDAYKYFKELLLCHSVKVNLELTRSSIQTCPFRLPDTVTPTVEHLINIFIIFFRGHRLAYSFFLQTKFK